MTKQRRRKFRSSCSLIVMGKDHKFHLVLLVVWFGCGEVERRQKVARHGPVRTWGLRMGFGKAPPSSRTKPLNLNPELQWNSLNWRTKITPLLSWWIITPFGWFAVAYFNVLLICSGPISPWPVFDTLLVSCHQWKRISNQMHKQSPYAESSARALMCCLNLLSLLTDWSTSQRNFVSVTQTHTHTHAETETQTHTHILRHTKSNCQ